MFQPIILSMICQHRETLGEQTSWIMEINFCRFGALELHHRPSNYRINPWHLTVYVNEVYLLKHTEVGIVTDVDRMKRALESMSLRFDPKPC